MIRWDAAICGRLVIPAEHRKAWLAAELDWKAVNGHEALKGYMSGETVRDMVDGVDFVEASEFLQIEWTGDEMCLRSFQGQAGFNESMVGFAAAWAAAARFGGAGELLGIGMVATSFGYRVSVGGGEASVVRVADDEVAALEAHAEAVAVRERMASIGGAMTQKLSAFAAPRPTARRTPILAEPPKRAKKVSAKKASAKKA